jgi:hypothetical protein
VDSRLDIIVEIFLRRNEISGLRGKANDGQLK